MKIFQTKKLLDIPLILLLSIKIVSASELVECSLKITEGKLKDYNGLTLIGWISYSTLRPISKRERDSLLDEEALIHNNDIVFSSLVPYTIVTTSKEVRKAGEKKKRKSGNLNNITIISNYYPTKQLKGMEYKFQFQFTDTKWELIEFRHNNEIIKVANNRYNDSIPNYFFGCTAEELVFDKNNQDNIIGGALNKLESINQEWHKWLTNENLQEEFPEDPEETKKPDEQHSKKPGKAKTI